MSKIINEEVEKARLYLAAMVQNGTNKEDAENIELHLDNVMRLLEVNVVPEMCINEERTRDVQGKTLSPEEDLICPFCESTNTTVIDAKSDCCCDDCLKDFEA